MCVCVDVKNCTHSLGVISHPALMHLIHTWQGRYEAAQCQVKNIDLYTGRSIYKAHALPLAYIDL